MAHRVFEADQRLREDSILQSNISMEFVRVIVSKFTVDLSKRQDLVSK